MAHREHRRKSERSIAYQDGAGMVCGRRSVPTELNSLCVAQPLPAQDRYRSPPTLQYAALKRKAQCPHVRRKSKDCGCSDGERLSRICPTTTIARLRDRDLILRNSVSWLAGSAISSAARTHSPTKMPGAVDTEDQRDHGHDCGAPGVSMSRAVICQSYALFFLLLTMASAPSPAPAAPAAPNSPEKDDYCSASSASRTVIAGLQDERGKQIAGNLPADVGLSDDLWVVLGTEPIPTNRDVNHPGGRSSNPPVPSPVAPDTKVPPLCDFPPATATDSGSSPFDPSPYVLFLNGQPLSGVPATYDSSRHALEFRLTRNETNAALWKALLGSPTARSRNVTVSLGVVDADGHATPTIAGRDGAARFQLRVFSLPWLLCAIGATALVLVLVFGTATRTNTLRDNLLPQLPPNRQPYSLGRCQMAFWFVLVFVSFLFLYVLLWDYNTVSPQALALMGISSATALASVAVDVLKDSPADTVNRGLQALGLTSFADVCCVKKAIASLQADIATTRGTLPGLQSMAAQTAATLQALAQDPTATAQAIAAAQNAADSAASALQEALQSLNRMQSHLRDRENIERTWKDQTRPFVSQGLWKDLTTDINGPTVHRIQVIFWTVALGVMFLVGVYRDLAMPPDFSSTLMALMGISGASYVGFKYPESNN